MGAARQRDRDEDRELAAAAKSSSCATFKTGSSLPDSQPNSPSGSPTASRWLTTTSRPSTPTARPCGSRSRRARVGTAGSIGRGPSSLLALRAHDRYVLYRVYEAHTLTPTIREIHDPVGRFQAGELDLDLDSLAGDIGALHGG